MSKIRAYRPDDIEAVIDIYALSKLDELKNENKNFKLLPLEKDHKRFNKLMGSEKFIFDDQGVMGYCAILNNEITALFVHPSARNQGVGKIMLEFMLKSVHENITLYVAKSNIEAKNLYHKYCFEVVEEFQTEYNGTPVTANKMERKTKY